ncbi:MAG: hypothetical protein VXW29_01075, partial [SAR324 cluster bacterium]|nr:hypothetical protein [SAR324 cluster bacterium]
KFHHALRATSCENIPTLLRKVQVLMWFLPWAISSLNKKPEKILLGENHKKLYWRISGQK